MPGCAAAAPTVVRADHAACEQCLHLRCAPAAVLSARVLQAASNCAVRLRRVTQGNALQRQTISTFSKCGTGAPTTSQMQVTTKRVFHCSVQKAGSCSRVPCAGCCTACASLWARTRTVALQRLDCRAGPNMRHARLQAPELLPKVHQPLPMPGCPLRWAAPAATLHS